MHMHLQDIFFQNHPPHPPPPPQKLNGRPLSGDGAKTEHKSPEHKSPRTQCTPTVVSEHHHRHASKEAILGLMAENAHFQRNV